MKPTKINHNITSSILRWKFLIFVCTCIIPGFSFNTRAENLLTFDFAGIAGNEASIKANWLSQSVDSTSISRGSGINAGTNADRFNSTSWTNATLPEGDDYLEFSLCPKKNYSLSLDGMVIKHQRSSTGPSLLALKCSHDNYGSILDEEKQIPDVTTTQTTHFVFTLSNLSDTITFRIYAYGAESGSGSWGTGDGTGDDIVVTGTFNNLSLVNPPTLFSATSISQTEINLTWNLNSSGNSTLLACSDSEEFGIPVNGKAYNPGDTLAEGGTIINTGSQTSYSHQGLETTTKYYYSIWSVNEANNYSDAATCNATTWSARPAQAASELLAQAISYKRIDLEWHYPSGENQPDGFVVFASTSDNITDPVDGNLEEEDSLLSDGIGCYYFEFSERKCAINNLEPSTTYYFAVYAFSNQEVFPLFNTESETEKASTCTFAGPTLFISEVTAPSLTASAKFVELYNYGEHPVDLAASKMYLSRQTNGGSTWGNIALDGTVLPKTTYILAYNEDYFQSVYGFSPDQTNGAISGNGDDAYFIYFEGDRTSGILLDAYGIQNEDGTGTGWEYTTAKAERKTTVAGPNPLWTPEEWSINAATPQRCTPGLYPATVWNGANNSSWTDAGNWDNGVPSENIDVLIWAGSALFPEAAEGNSTRNLIVQHNAQLNIQENLSISGTTTIEQEFSFSSAGKQLDHWQYFASPLETLTANGMLSSNNRVDLYISRYNNLLSEDTNQAWEYITSSSSIILPGEGLAITAINDTSETGDFIEGNGVTLRVKGTLSHPENPLTFTLTRNGENGWNLLGNPWLAPIDWTSEYLALEPISSSTAYVYNPAANSGEGSYISIQSSGIVTPENASTLIPPKAAFFVFANNTGTFSMDGRARSNQKQNCYKSRRHLPIIYFSLSQNGLCDETAIVLNAGSNNEADGFDARKLLINGRKIPAVYTLTPGMIPTVINHIGQIPAKIPLALYLPSTDSLTLQIKIKGSWDPGIRMHLTDLVEKKDYSLSQDTLLKLSLIQGIIEDRFLISFDQAESNKIRYDPGFEVLLQHHNILVRSSGQGKIKAALLDLSGRTLLRSENQGMGCLIDTQGCQGIYLLKIECQGFTQLRKIMLHPNNH